MAQQRGSLLLGLVMGGLVGAALGILVAPNSGEATRDLVRDRGQALRDRARQTAEEARARAEAVQARSQAALTDNVERLARTAAAAKRAAQETWQQGENGYAPADWPAESEY